MALKVFALRTPGRRRARPVARRHLAGLRRQGLMADWHDRQIRPAAPTRTSRPTWKPPT
ncbi:MAG: hypothetical protein R3E89_10620 [Thiolinea sp.]